HVAPVAGGVPHREEDGLVLLARAFQRFLSPGVPVDGIHRVLLEIGAGFLREAIGHDRTAGSFVSVDLPACTFNAAARCSPWTPESACPQRLGARSRKLPRS